MKVDPRNPGDDQIFPELLTGRLERTNSLPTFSAKLNPLDKTRVDIFLRGRGLDYETVMITIMMIIMITMMMNIMITMITMMMIIMITIMITC